MLFGFFPLFFFCETRAKVLAENWPTYYTSPGISRTTMEGRLSPLQVVATPDYPVAAGQTVNLHCSAFDVPNFVNWSWQHLQNMTWQEVSGSRDLTLTEPKQSGLYRCRAESRSSQRVSHNLTVYIIAMQPTVGENLGTAAFALSLLALIINLTILCWLCWKTLVDTLTNTAATGFPESKKAPKGGLPQTENNADVYMNYTSTNRAYMDLDPTNITGDNVYSSLS
ncbi:uncharacterized protein LOC120794937 [Xiphias gladius]|uniref:uncharacterized protein LOC120794937 n=1 Tax=Xiphias gladius TaxID=8245 RepID=UPI001A9A2B55|nr:uncharacterized protein LOC120794937 [Xiphias gladius]